MAGSRHEGAGPGAPGTGVTLAYGHRQVELADGVYVIGRSSGCDVVLTDSKVSRRHAQLEIEARDVHVVDLGSRNGVFVNGVPVRGSRALATGDVILIGTEELQVTIGAVGGSRHAPGDGPLAPRLGARASPASRGVAGAVALAAKEDPVFRQSESDALGTLPHRSVGRANTGAEPRSSLRAEPAGDEFEVEQAPTSAFDDLELLGRVVQSALAAGHVREAESMVGGHLRRVLKDTAEGNEPTAKVRQQAFLIALSLARETHRGEWFDYAVDLLRVQRLECTDEQRDALLAVLSRVHRVDLGRLEQYANVLRSVPTMDRLRAARRVGEVEIAAKLKAR